MTVCAKRSDPTSTCQSHPYPMDTENDQVVEQIAVMRRQEESMYRCPDYLSVGGLDQQLCQEVHLRKVVEECANIITDLSLCDRQPLDVEQEEADEPVRQPSVTSPLCTAAVFTDSSVATDIVEEKRQKGSSASAGRKRDRNSMLGQWRQQMCAWCYQVVDSFGFDRDVVAVAFSFLDRYLAKEAMSSIPITREDFQLFTMTALYTAIKITQPACKLSVDALVDMSRGYFSADHFTETEMDMLASLQWRMNPPTSLAFVGHYIDLLPLSSDKKCTVMAMCRRITETAVSDSFFISRNTSFVAISAILIALREKKLEDAKSLDVSQSTINEFSMKVKNLTKVDVHSSEFAAVIRRLENMCKKI